MSAPALPPLPEGLVIPRPPAGRYQDRDFWKCPGRDLALKAMIAARWPGFAAAQALGCTEGAARGRAKRLNLAFTSHRTNTPRPKPPKALAAPRRRAPAEREAYAITAEERRALASMERDFRRDRTQ